jgi:CheY-like chemotaxis protein
MSDSEKTSVLLVDHDPEASWEIGRRLTRAGYAVTACADGAEALSLLEYRDFAIMITEIRLAGLSGLELMDWVRENRHNLKVVVVTSIGSPAVRNLCLTKGAVLYLEKPVEPELIIDVLSASTGKDVFSGSIDQIDILDYVQLMLLSGRQVVLEVLSRDGRQCHLFIEKGRVKHAECDTLAGEEAFFQCLAFAGGSFANLPWREPAHVTIEKPGEFLLMEAARKRDEARQLHSDAEEDRETYV